MCDDTGTGHLDSITAVTVSDVSGDIATASNSGKTHTNGCSIVMDYSLQYCQLYLMFSSKLVGPHLGCLAEWFRATNSSPGGLVIRVWVRIPVITIDRSCRLRPQENVINAFLHNFACQTLFVGPSVRCDRSIRNGVELNGCKWIPATVDIDIVFEKATGAPRQLRAVWTQYTTA